MNLQAEESMVLESWFKLPTFEAQGLGLTRGSKKAYPDFCIVEDRLALGKVQR